VEPRLLQGVPGKEGPSSAATFEVRDGTIIVIGNLFKDIAVSSAWKIPLLGDLPFLGFVFRSDGENIRKTEVITFLAVKTAEKKEDREI
jgi:type II secretory pathway component GspD/PulD (secretin)